MKKCDLCNKEDVIHYRVKSINYKSWIFCCKKCWHIVSKESQYSYGGTKKLKKMEFFTDLWNNQPATVIGVGTATLVFLGFYIFLLNTYK